MKLRSLSLLASSLVAFALAACTTETVYRTGPDDGATPGAGTGTEPTDPSADDPSEADAGTSSPPKKDAGSDTGTGKPSTGPGTPPKPGPGPAPAGVDRSACTGPSSSSGSIYSTTPNVKTGSVITDPSSGGLRLVLLPNATLAANDIVIGLYFTPIPGQLDYSPNGSVGCAVMKYTGSGWQVIDKTQLCELHFSQLQHASAASVCDGTLAGTYNGIFSGNQPLAGSFVLPSNVPASQISAPSCRPYDSVCSNNSECCSKSCNQFLGVCL